MVRIRKKIDSSWKETRSTLEERLGGWSWSNEVGIKWCNTRKWNIQKEIEIKRVRGF